MRRKVAVLLCAVSALALGASSAAAQARGYIGFGVGPSITMGDFSDVFKTGFMGHVVAGITGPTGLIGGRINGSFAKHSTQDGVIPDGDVTMIGALADLVVQPGVAEAKVRPYFFGGVGFMSVKEEPTGGTSVTNTEVAYNFGAGLTLAAGARIKLFLEARWLSVQTDPASNSIPITVGLRWGGP
jgi:opacity protein-like surface antigen